MQEEDMESDEDVIEEFLNLVANFPGVMHSRLNNNNNNITKLAKAFELSCIMPWPVFAQRYLGLHWGDVENIKEDYDKRSERVCAKFYECPNYYSPTLAITKAF